MNLAELEKHITLLEDIQAIEDVQKMYGYYMDSHQREQVVSLFSDNAESLELESVGLFLGKKGISRFFLENDLLKGNESAVPGWINILIMMFQPVIDVAPDGRTAKGRWNTWLAEAMPVGGIPRQQWVHGYYENEYVKENGKWLFTKLNWNVTVFTSFEAGWVKVPLLGRLDRADADAPAPHFHPYPSGYHLPYHYVHPITGEE
jgi:hypothetical protein